MLTTRKNGKELYLLSPEEITDPRHWTPFTRPIMSPFLLVLWWAVDFLTRPHKDLGRAGPTCPFVRPSLDKKTFWLTAIKGARPSASTLTKTILGYRDWFLELPPTSGDEIVNKTILILLPELASSDYLTTVDATQSRLKPEFVKQQLMIGQFHPECEEPGVRNTTFRPLKSPIPMLVIRHITPGDIVFMRDSTGHYNATFLQNYLKTFAHGVPSGFIDEVTKTLTADPESSDK